MDNNQPNPNPQPVSENKMEKVLNHWLTLQKIIKEEITLQEIISLQEETYKTELNNHYIQYYNQKIRTRETLENVINIDNNKPMKYFELIKNADSVLKDSIDPIQNLFIIMRGNVDFILKLVSIIDERETGKEIDINTIVDLFCHQFYENLLIPNPEQEDLLMLIYLLLEREISNMNSASVASFIDENATFIGRFLKSYTTKQELKTYLAMTLGSLILQIENSSDNCLDINPARVKNFLWKTSEDEIAFDNKMNENQLEKYLTNNIEASSIVIDNPIFDDDNDEEGNEEGEEVRDDDNNNGNNEGREGKTSNEDLPNKNVRVDKAKDKERESKGQNYQMNFNPNYSIDINQDELNSKIQKETDQDLKDFYLRQLERINKDPETFTNKKFIQSLEQFGNQKLKILFKYKSNFVKIKGYIDRIIQSLIDKITTIPYTLRCICKVIHMLIKAKFDKINTYERNAFIGEFIFGKCILPILINSDINIVVTTTILSQNTRQCLKTIAKVLGRINRGQFFEANIDTDFTIFNHYIIEVIPLINTFYSKLIEVELPKVLDEMINKHIAKGLGPKNLFKELNKKKLNKNTGGGTGDSQADSTNVNKKSKEKREGIKNIHCCVCYSIEDIMILMNLLKPRKKDFINLPNGSFFEKTIEKIENQEYHLVDAKKKSTKRQFFLYFKEPRAFEGLNTEEAKKSYTMLSDDDDSELVLQRIKFCVKKVLTGLNLINNKDYSYFNIAKSNQKFFVALKNTLQDLEEFNESELTNRIPLRWYSQYISNNRKALPEQYKANDYEKLYTELLNEEQSTLTELKVNSSIIITNNGMNIRFAEKIIEKARKDFYYIKQIERFMKMEKFINSKVIEICIRKDDYKEVVESKGFLGLFKKQTTYVVKDEDKPKIVVTPLDKCSNKHTYPLEDKMDLKQVKGKEEYHCRYVKDFIAALCSFKEVNEDIEKGVQINKIYMTLEIYLELIKSKMKQEDLLKDDMEIEGKIILEKIADHIMKKTYNDVFPKHPLPIDQEFSKKTKKLNWVTPAHLEIKAIYVNELKSATEYIKKIDTSKSAYEKLNCISMAHHTINNTIKFSSGKSDDAGQDEVSPIIQYIIIKANPGCFYSNLFYIKTFLSPNLLDGKYGFLVAQIESAAEYILKVQPNTLKKAKEEFEQRIQRDSIHRKQQLQQQVSNQSSNNS